jgi:nitrogen-specific signal transduction histidine kinase/CheY-like chemotaxis protein
LKTPVFSSDGKIIGSQGIQFDVTEHKVLERKLVQAQKLEGIGTLAGGIAHEFNNLLAMILGSAELLQPHLQDQPKLKKYVDRIIESSARGAAISRQLLMFSRPDQLELKPMSLSAAISDVKEMLKNFLPKSIEIVTFIDTEQDIMVGDAGQIQQAILNLSINAGDTMADSGVLTIKEYKVEAGFIRQKFGNESDGPYLAVSVSDTGVGMDPALLEKIFDPFFTTKEKGKGTGLGLSIVHGIVKNHNGFIDVESALHQGTTFTMYFPSATGRVDEVQPYNQAAASQHNETILLVDDEPLILELLSEHLMQSGYRVLTAANGYDALELFQKERHEIKMVITDLGMPRMGGEELFRRLQNIDASVKVIASSGYLEGTTKEDLKKIGFKGILTKPLKMQEMMIAIHEALHAEHEMNGN